MQDISKEQKLQRWALVTGASSGIGREIAKFLDQRGYSVVLVARNEEELNKVQKYLHNNESRVLAKDLSQPSQVLEIFTYCENNNIEIEFLVNDAGFGFIGDFFTEPIQDVQDMIQVNIIALVMLTRLFLPKMVAKKHGNIVQMASISSFFPGPYMANYYATKSYVLSFSRALNFELKSSGVHVLALCPGPVLTKFFHRAGISNYRDAVRLLVKTPHQIAQYMWKGVQKKKPVMICGWVMVLLVYLHNLIPHHLLTLKKMPPSGKKNEKNPASTSRE